MKDVTIYTQALCGYCTAAKRLLERKGAQFTEIDVTFDPEKRAVMRERAGGRNSAPQIFIGETHVGGCDDLYELDERGGLDPLLAD
ncbi:MAG: glutaredoxin 3 [Rhodobiaceae bacterium]|nr:glutaredoxin 3 [Rhodobiaceae bacterium]MCC0013753.1 glutaredoxin 3 [Rhodobiaceae bacterium]MCC0018589.1 glutaredoxin 3 [Rhodobiaceae bacterium]MCC0062183.1 glutaredoxin 3 [Rhodobiaceae bacterium]